MNTEKVLFKTYFDLHFESKSSICFHLELISRKHSETSPTLTNIHRLFALVIYIAVIVIALILACAVNLV